MNLDASGYATPWEDFMHQSVLCDIYIGHSRSFQILRHNNIDTLTSLSRFLSHQENMISPSMALVYSIRLNYGGIV